ncbi:FAD-dependent monooxygenase [Aurantibacter sp.]|uniref:FAD-dependent monooxygenase n=1 Tax=Aurantibacter sp. TaxID=2807103 RepID=UPI0035C78B52
MYTVIGAGIGGLTTALVFEKLGIPYQLFEKSTQPNAIGAGIWLAPNALKVLEFVGVLDKVIETGNTINRITLSDEQLAPLADSSQLLAKEKYGFSTIAIHRAELQKCLIDALPTENIHWGKNFNKITHKANKINIFFDDDSTIETDYLIGADGINSKMRSLLFPKSKIRYSGQTCWRGVSKKSLPKDFIDRGCELWGKGIRFGFSHLNTTDTSWFVVKKSPAFGTDNPSTLKKELLDLCKDFNPITHQLIEHTEIKHILRNDIIDLKPIKKWHKNNICLIGDAAHATTPNMGQGGAQAIEDAYYLGLLIQKNSRVNNFEAFQDIRYKRVNSIVSQSWYTGQIANLSRFYKVRNFFFKNLPKQFIDKNMHSVYDLKEI